MAKTTSVARRIQANRRLERDGATADDVERAQGRLGAVFAAYPGIVAERSGVQATDAFVVTCVFGAGDLGRAAALAVDFIAARVGAPVATSLDTTRVRCTGTQFVRFLQFLHYASELQVARRPESTLSQVLAAFAIDYERERLGHLQDVSNFLRFVDDEGVTLERAQALGGVSGNGKTAHERHLDVVVERGGARDKSRRVYPTPKARRIRDSYPHLVAEIERGWCAEYGDAVPAMRSLLAMMTERFAQDLPDLPDYPDTNGWIHRLWFD